MASEFRPFGSYEPSLAEGFVSGWEGGKLARG